MNSLLLVAILTLVVFAVIAIVLNKIRKEWVDPRETRRQQLGFLPIEPLPEKIVNGTGLGRE